MTTPVAQAATAYDLRGVRTAAPVASGGLSRWSEDLSFTLGHNLHVCGGASILPRPAGRTALQGLAYTVRIPYARSPGAQVVRVSVELAPSDDPDTQTVTIALPAGATWLDAGGLDGSVLWPNPPLGRTVGEELAGWVDVSGVTVGDLTLAFGFAGAPTANKGQGIRRCHVVEVPLAALDNAVGEPVLDGASVRPGRLIVDGGAGSTAGTQRLWHLLDAGRASDRRHWCLAGVESADATGAATTPHWYRETGAYGALTWLYAGGAHDPAHYLRVRDLYATTTATTWQLVVRYRTSNATACGLKLYAEGGSISGLYAWTPAAAAVAQTLALPGTAGAWAWATMSVTLPGDGTDGLVRLTWEAKGPGAGQLLSIATLALIENEP